MRRTLKTVPLLAVLILGLAAVLPALSVAAPKTEREMLAGVVENCWAGEDAFGIWHENANSAHGMFKGMPERWVSLLDGQYFASESVITSEQVHFKSDGTVRYHNVYKWTMYPGMTVEEGATGWYELNGESNSVDGVPVNEAGWIVSRANGVGRGALAGQQVRFEMVLVSLGPSALNLCGSPETNWNGSMTLEINPAP